MTRTQTVNAALLALRLIDREQESFQIAQLTDWLRGGAETYVLHFSITTSRGNFRFVMKACVAYALGVGLQNLFIEWLQRRARLQEFRVQTPEILAQGKALVVEEYIPLALPEAFARSANRPQLAASLGWTVGRIAAAGFVPISIHDWRSRGQDVVLVDFGQDLGPAGLSPSISDHLLGDALEQLEDWRIDLEPTELRAIGQAYEQAVQLEPQPFGEWPLLISSALTRRVLLSSRGECLS